MYYVRLMFAKKKDYIQYTQKKNVFETSQKTILFCTSEMFQRRLMDVRCFIEKGEYIKQTQKVHLKDILKTPYFVRYECLMYLKTYKNVL